MNPLARRGPALWLGLLVCALLFCTSDAGAQPPAPVPDEARIAALQAKVTADASLGEARQTELQTLLTRAGEAIKRAARERTDTQQLQSTIDGSSTAIEDYRRRMSDIERAPQTLRRRLGASPSLDAIEAEISVVEAQREAWSAERQQLQETAAGAAQTLSVARERLTAIGAELDNAATSTRPPVDDVAAQVEAAARRARFDALRAEKERLELKLRGAPTLTNVRTARSTWLDAAIGETDALLQELRDAAAALRQSAVSQRSVETRRILSPLSEVRPALREVANVNLALIKEQQELGRRIEQESRAQERAREMHEGIKQDATLTRRRLDVAGRAAELGDVMQTRLTSLPSAGTLKLDEYERRKQIAGASVAAMDAEQSLRELADRAARLEQIVSGQAEWTPQERRAAELLLQQRRELVQDNLQAHRKLERLLVDGNQVNTELVNTIDAYRDFLTGNLLWMRSYGFLNPERLQQQFNASVAVDPRQLLSTDYLKLLRDPYELALFLLLIALLLRRRVMRRHLNEILSTPIRPRDEHRRTLLKALFLTVLVALPLPLAMNIAGRALQVLGGGQLSLKAAGAALHAVAATLFLLRVLDRLSARRGAGRRLLKWNTAKIDALRRDLVWGRPALLFAAATIAFGSTISPTHSGGAIAAAGSAVSSLTLFTFGLRALLSGQFAGDWLALLILRATTLVAASTIVMHLSGQLFAAHMYLQALGTSIAATLVILLFINVLQRVLLIYRMSLTRRTRERERAEQEERQANEPGAAAEPNMETDAFASLSEAYEHLLGLGRLLLLGSVLWLIWSPALPALSVLEEVVLWSTNDPSLPEGGTRAITLSTLLFVALVTLVTTLLTRHLPPLFNVLMLEWGKATPGGRYATGMLTQYLIIGAGASIALTQLGFAWSKVQWLVAALGVGIGFGLQEIVANFISGLIVLFERPIRVGDIINAGGFDGTVSRINPRATVIETFEGKEVMVPNKELITGVVTNWSLSSTRLRIVVPLGVAYGSDVEQAMKILLEAAQEHPEVLDDPEPTVTFEDFGDNALVLWLRGYALANYLGVKTDLRVTIYDRCNEAGIGIAFPQRDVHLDASEPIPVRMVPAADTG